MPRRKAADRVGFIRRRTRSGCSACRARKVKCDEARPRCTSCATRGTACEYQWLQLKWESEYQACGRAFGREGVWSKDGSPAGHSSNPSKSAQASPTSHNAETYFVEHHHFIHTYYNDLQYEAGHVSEPSSRQVQSFSGSVNRTPSHFAFQHLSASPTSSSLPESSALLYPLSPFPVIDGFHPELLQYYIMRLCPLTNSPKYAISPFQELVPPLITSRSYDVALLSVMAFAARHRSLSNPWWRPVALALRGRVLTSLRQILGLHAGTMTEALRSAQIPIAMMFLCLDEIVDSCDHRWVIHLRACQDLLLRRRQLLVNPSSESPAEHSLVAVAERFFAFQDAISRTACGNASHFGLGYWQSPDRLSDSDGWMGCSARLAAIIFRTTELGRTRSKLSDAQFQSQAACLEDELRLVETESDDPYDHMMRQSAEIYHHCLLYDAGPSTAAVANLVHKVLKALCRLVLETDSVAAGLAFPLFVAAVELDPLSDELRPLCSVDGVRFSGRRLVLELLDALSSSCLFNVNRIGGIIRQVWAKRDLGSLQEAYHVKEAPLGLREGVNDWDIYVSPNCANISLA